MKVKVVKLGAAAQTANLPEGMTLGQAIDHMVESLELTIDAQDFSLEDGDVITSTPAKVAGGRN